ncbi:gamma-glutamyltransferase [Phenylobacterium sp.]|uniref:gamma-glutamyltransferase n=1 Tax=Phenylobacterium sp. TaxID=1871053 RepID=UPI002B9F2D6F|nr:gamma-glutamyltransferase [Phenylobacterium sp.]HLZ75261.1 gamma-glutamyltransferase [Phenylobacterium sp.]
MRSWNLLRALSAAVLLAAGPAAAAPPAPIRALSAGAVASPDRYGALAAQEILGAGGNAVDAAVATAFVLAVTYPEAGNLGGGGFMTLYVDGKPYFLDYRETAPAKASAGMYLDAKGAPIVQASLVGPLAAGTPGTVAGMAAAHARFGKLAWARDLGPAIRLARDGFVVPAGEIKERDADRKAFGATNFDHYFAGMAAGKPFRQPELAATLQRIARDGAKGFYEGQTADLIVAQMSRGPAHGLISRTDLSGYKVAWRAPIEGEWKGFHVITAPPPSSGGIALLQMLAMKADDEALFKGVPLNSPQYLHLISEIEKRVFADRAEYLGDPDFWKVPVAALTDPAYIARRAREVDPVRPSPTKAVKPGLEKPQTTHFSIVDRWGNAVSNTYTLNGSFGAGVVVEGAGFLLNDEMDDFSVKPGAPNLYGVVGGDANAIAPFKRPLSSMTPTILTKDGKLAMVIGTPGGSRIFTSVFQVLADVYDFGLPLPKAMAALRFHHQLLPENTIFTEPYAPLPAPLEAAMKARGYKIEGQGFNGDMAAIQVTGGAPQPASDPRARGVSLVVR